MYIVLGGTGRVGSATTRALLAQGQNVTIVTRDGHRGAELRKLGARVAIANIRDVDVLRGILRTGKRAFLLNPPADPSTDTDLEERENVHAIIAALEGTKLEKVVVQSTYGAFEGERCGDLTVLHEFERKLIDQPIPVAINRGAYYMSNWAGMVESVRGGGSLLSFFPADLVLPMVAPDDLGQAAARRLMEPASEIGIQHVEGPERYSAKDVAAVVGDVVGAKVDVEQIPRDALEGAFRQFGFSVAAAASYACMTGKLIDGHTDTSDKPLRGRTSLHEYLRMILGV